jgi:23S rRNA (uridine2552-2'-O)-methyltransferase
MEPIKDVYFFQEDVANIDAINDISLLKTKFDLVISDLAPNLSGIVAVDVANIFELNMMTLKTASDFLEKSGILIVKTFQNENLKIFKKEMENVFKIVQTHKPAASKKQSQEIYLIGQKLHE